MIWLDITTQAEASMRESRMWGISLTPTEDGGISGHVQGEGLYEGEQFWADAIRQTYDDSAARLAMAKRHLPLPAAFREAALALRATIRAHKKSSADFDAELRELHHWAAVESVANYSELEITPFAEISALDLRPEVLGWNELSLLNQTDRKLMSERWAAPTQHSTGAALYPKIGANARGQFVVQREAEMARSMARLDEILAEERQELPVQQLPVDEAPAPAKRGFFTKLFSR